MVECSLTTQRVTLLTWYSWLSAGKITLDIVKIPPFYSFIGAWLKIPLQRTWTKSLMYDRGVRYFDEAPLPSGLADKSSKSTCRPINVMKKSRALSNYLKSIEQWSQFLIKGEVSITYIFYKSTLIWAVALGFRVNEKVNVLQGPRIQFH